MLKYDYSVVGASGFIGSNMVNFLEKLGFNVLKIGRNLEEIEVDHLGVVVYCAGFGDCLNNPNNVIDANVSFLSEVLNKFSYDKLFYISSTRVYLDNQSGAEKSALKLSMGDSRRLFNLTKLTAEALMSQYANAIALRVSNVYGNAFKSPLFLPSIVRDAISKKVMNIYTTPNYAKDYINVEDVCTVIYQLSQIENLQHKVYNLASGKNISSEQIVSTIINKTDTDVIWHDVKHEDHFPPISIKRIQQEINYNPSSVLHDLGEMINLFSVKFHE